MIAGIVWAFSIGALLICIAATFLCKKYITISKQKADLIREASHEIRNGVNGIVGLTDLLLDVTQIKQLPIGMQNLLEGLYSGSRQLQYYLNNILEVEKAEGTRRLLVKQESFYIHEWIAGIENVNRNFALVKGIEFIGNIDNELPAIVIGDQLKMTLVVNNLLSNAFKATERGKVVSFDIQFYRQNLILVIADQGRGMSPKELKEIFKPFTQFGNQSSKMNGSGLGLALVKKYVSMLKGRITVNSTPGKGSIFTVTIPLITVSPNFHTVDAETNVSNIIPSSKTATSN